VSEASGFVLRQLVPADQLNQPVFGCSALGCRDTAEDTDLYLVVVGSAQRVLCDYHARRWDP